MTTDPSILPPPQPPFEIAALIQILADLRHPERGCPWDREQDFDSIAPYTIEEAYEVADAIAQRDWPALQDELGDLLLQTVYHARMAEEKGLFSFADVVSAICAKMIRRHPHVYGDEPTRDAASQTLAWEEQKAAERDGISALAGVALGLPALLRAQKIQKRAARVGFDWPDANGPRAKISEELAEFDAASDLQSRHAELGDLLFSVVNVARHHGIDAEAALRDATARFERRFTHVEARAGDLTRLGLEQLDELWRAAKSDLG